MKRLLISICTIINAISAQYPDYVQSTNLGTNDLILIAHWNGSSWNQTMSITGTNLMSQIISLIPASTNNIWSVDTNGTIQATSAATGTNLLVKVNNAAGEPQSILRGDGSESVGPGAPLFGGLSTYDSRIFYSQHVSTNAFLSEFDFGVFPNPSASEGALFSFFGNLDAESDSPSDPSTNIITALYVEALGPVVNSHAYSAAINNWAGRSMGWVTLDNGLFGWSIYHDTDSEALIFDTGDPSGQLGVGSKAITSGNLVEVKNNGTNKVWFTFDGEIHGKDFVVTGSAFRPEDTSGNTAIFQAHDDDIAGAGGRKTFATLQNGSTPSLTIAPPEGGTVNLQGIFKAADGTSGITQTNTLTIPTVLTNQIVIKNGIIVSWISI